MDLNKRLKLVFIIIAIVFLVTLNSKEKTHCEVCELEYDGKIYDGYGAWNIIEDKCISYAKPWDINPLNGVTG